MSITLNTLLALEALIAERAQAGDDTSYTKTLLNKGLGTITKKLGEEATEVVIAALTQDDKALKGELADLVYHMLVLMQAKGLKLEDVAAVLQERFGISGIAEKAGRKP